ncbi:hypothetical protein MNBD_NITROSPINAE03-481, partial [hydrothermal vent metagenome]
MSGKFLEEPILHLPSVHFDNGADSLAVTCDKYLEMQAGYKKLSRRSLLMAGANDAVILDKHPDKEYLALLSACGAGGATRLAPASDNGSSLTEDVSSCPATLDFIRSWPHKIEPYMMSSHEERLEDAIGRPLTGVSAQVTSLLNDKVFFTRLVEDLGLPFIETFIGPPDSAAVRIVKGGNDPVIVRGSKSVGGAAVWTAKDSGQRLALGKKIERMRGGMFIVQPLIKSESSPNLQFYVDSKRTCLLGGTIQVFANRFAHTGNYFDFIDDESTADSLLSQGKAFAREAADIGYRGILGVDFIVTGETVYAVELNARHNTSTHALWFVNRFFNGDPFSLMEPGRAAYMRFSSPLDATGQQWIE